MAKDVSLAAVVANLEEQIAVHREREAFHAQQEAQHQQQREHHAAELATLTHNLEAFKAAADAAVGLAVRPGAATRLLPAADPDPGRKPRLSRMVALVVESWPAGEPFGITAIAAEVASRYRDRLRGGVDPRMVSVHLRRLLADGKIVSIREGKPHHEALYARQE
jgi:DNA-binding transcriptional ArsR family regulator